MGHRLRGVLFEEVDDEILECPGVDLAVLVEGQLDGDRVVGVGGTSEAPGDRKPQIEHLIEDVALRRSADQCRGERLPESLTIGEIEDHDRLGCVDRFGRADRNALST